LKEITPVRLLNNPFADQVKSAYQSGANVDELKSLLGRARAKRGMFEGDLVEGELEIGQVSARLGNLVSAGHVVEATMSEFFKLKNKVNQIIDSCA
jgi:enoyl-[acyl-carrier protein] reductase II